MPSKIFLGLLAAIVPFVVNAQRGPGPNTRSAPPTGIGLPGAWSFDFSKDRFVDKQILAKLLTPAIVTVCRHDPEQYDSPKTTVNIVYDGKSEHLDNQNCISVEATDVILEGEKDASDGKKNIKAKGTYGIVGRE
jgi:hypothetical protein